MKMRVFEDGDFAEEQLELLMGLTWNLVPPRTQEKATADSSSVAAATSVGMTILKAGSVSALEVF